MAMSAKTKGIVLAIGDVVVLYASLIGALALRYHGGWHREFANTHAIPFSLLFVVWLLLFYISGLYDIRRIPTNMVLVRVLSVAIMTNAVISVLFFYFIPFFGITPKTNLFTVIGIFAVLEFLWRRYAIHHFSSADSLRKVLLIGDTKTAREVAQALRDNPQIGFTVSRWIENQNPDAITKEELETTIRTEGIDTVLIPPALKNHKTLGQLLYYLVNRGIEVKDLNRFYEFVLQRVPLEELEEHWFIDELPETQKFYDPLKKAIEIGAAILLFLVLLPLEALIALLVAATSRGPVIYRQIRVGKSGRHFTLYKFRTMRVDAEKEGAQWSRPNDDRATPLGRILRHSHLDELPQLYNIARGELSLVGPRPERPEFVAQLKEKIPYFEIRHLVTPGITGWAQINYRYGASVEDSGTKLAYDIYYLKNRSPILDIAIILKTIRSLVINQK
jgi:exopolysaccharide biosynthesis polyprenyl glycosylphosphotransferase